MSLESANPATGVDYCIWLPGAPTNTNKLLASDRDEPVTYSVTAHDQDGLSPTSIIINIGTPAGAHLGAVQCMFPRASSAASVAFSRWTAIVGDYLALEVRP